MITLHKQLSPNTAASVIIDCPCCGAKGVAATPRESVDWVKLAYLVPLLKLRATQVECSRCHAQISCTEPLERLAAADSQTIASFLRYHPTRLARALSILGLLTCLIPFLGLLMASAAAVVGRGTKGWPATINLLSLIINGTITLCVVVLMIMGS
jgi:hypothetical protein